MKKIAKNQLERIEPPYEAFVKEVRNLLRTSSKKSLIVNRALVLSAKPTEKLFGALSFGRLFDTKETRLIKQLLASLHSHLLDLKEEYDCEDEMRLTEMCQKIEDLLTKTFLRSVAANLGETEIASMEPRYQTLYHSYVILKYALCDLEAETDIGFSEVDWERRDVLVGSFGSEAQFRHNLAKKYYYAPERYFDPTCFPIRAVALYQSSHFSESGIRYYGEVRSIRRVQRKRIHFGVRRKNGEEGYFVFRVKRWHRLKNSIEIKDEGVFAPKFTNRFLLGNAKWSYELFHLRSERDYRAYRQLCRILSDAPNRLNENEAYPIEGGKSVRVHGGVFEVLDERKRPVRIISVREFSQHPTQYLDDLFSVFAKEPEESDAPLWLLRENEEYLKKYGVPYRDEE